MSTITVGTRFFEKNPEKIPAARKRLSTFIDAAVAIGCVDIAVHAEEDVSGALALVGENHVQATAFGLAPWGKFVPALNALLYRAAVRKSPYIFLASAEFPLNQNIVSVLLGHMEKDTLVTGVLIEQEWHPGEIVQGTGMTVPWNTAALWSVPALIRLCGGFHPVGDAQFDPAQAGVEEVSTIAYCQMVDPSVTAKLIHIPGFYKEWNMEGWDAARIAAHEKKIASKNARPAAQLAFAHLSPPRVIHIG